jgi:hypothetical protein
MLRSREHTVHGRSPLARFEMLESRRMLCLDHLAQLELIEERPDLIGASPAEGGEPANIVWTNRGQASDGFAARFGTSAPLARAVVDAVIVAYERMIGSFNYAVPGTTYSVTVSMNGNGSGFGASAGLNGTLGGKPRSGSINMGAGNGSADPNDTNGWFMDPTPFEHSEFQGNIVNAYSGDAQAGSPAFNARDFYTVVAAEMTHCMGLFGDALPGWHNLTTNTGVPDKAEAGSNNSGSRGFYWVFRGPSIKHLLTSNNGGSGGSDWGSAVHAAGPNDPVNQPLLFQGDTYVGAQDQGNAVYEASRRYMINNTFALMFRDAYQYDSVDPAKWGTMYSSLNETTGVVTVRGGISNSADAFTITRGGNTITVSVDVGNDVGGSGHLPGPGNLPAFVTEYDVSQVSSILVQPGDGNDVISVQNTGTALDVVVQNGTGSDTVNVNTLDAGNVNVRFDSTMNLAALNIGAGGLAKMSAGGNRVLVTSALNIDAAGKLDLNDNDMILEYSGASQVAMVQALVNSARAGGAWNGNGITSSAAAGNPLVNTTLGVVDAADYVALHGNTFDGQTIDTTAVLVKYTYYGDTDFTGSVDGDDYARIDSGFNTSVSGWFNGDADGNGVVDGDDYALIDLAFNTQGPTL